MVFAKSSSMANVNKGRFALILMINLRSKPVKNFKILDHALMERGAILVMI